VSDLEKYLTEARERGVEAAKAAASWSIDGNMSQEHYRHMVELFESGDSEDLDEYLPAQPNLSGEWAGDPTPVSLYEEITGRAANPDVGGLSYETEHGWLIDKIADAFEEGVSGTFSGECERLIREALDPIVDLEHELEQYVKTALWSTNTDHLDPEGTGSAGALEDHYGLEDIAPEALESMRADLADFIHHADPRALAFWEAELGAGQVGHDFWLTRNGHGAGFWDRFSTGIGASFGNHLTEKAKPYGESYLIVGDDGKVYVS